MDNFVITIARGYGSGGRQIGKLLAERLNIKYYDKELIKLASEKSGINEELFGNADEKAKNGIFSRPKVYKGELIPPSKKAFTSDENLFNFQAETIRELASKESCVIVGRCADFVLKNYVNVLSVFIWADMDSCVKNVLKYTDVTDDIEALITKTDKERASYYMSHTGREWTDIRNYDLCLNTGDIGIEKCVDIICDYLNISGLK